MSNSVKNSYLPNTQFERRNQESRTEKSHKKSAKTSVQEIPEAGRRKCLREEGTRRDFLGRNGRKRNQEEVRKKGIPHDPAWSKASGRENGDVFQSWVSNIPLRNW